MWSSSGGEDQNNNNNGLSRGYSSSSSSASPISPQPFNPKSKTMEEVWKDMNLASLLHDRPSRCLTFQDFLARPFSNGHPNSAVSSRFSSPAPPPDTILTLNSVPELHYFANTHHPLTPLRHNNPIMHQTLRNNVCPSHVLPFDSFAAASGFRNSNERKRFPEFDNSGNRRNKRMIKNRESAARSRARKQAYTMELELEVAQLTEENARLKTQQQQLCMAAAAQLPKKNRLSRTTTAPF